jgi:hypothetical protein
VSSARRPEPARPLPVGAQVGAGILLAIPVIALLLVKTYSSTSPKLWGIPFFYWYQMLWVLIAPITTYAAYLIVTRSRRGVR